MSDVNMQQLLTRLTRLEDQVSRLVSRDMLDAEEWTAWTPTLAGGTTAGTYTYSTRGGFYLRIDDLVFVLCRMTVSGVTVAGTGNARITGLPYTSDGTIVSVMATTSNANLTAGYSRLTATILTADNFTSLFEEGDDVRQNYAVGGIVANDTINFSGFYRAVV